MHPTRNTPDHVVSDDMRNAAQEVVDAVRRNTRHPFLIDAKLGDAECPPKTDRELASEHDTPPSTISYRWTIIAAAITQADQEHGNPLQKIAQRANDAMAAAAIINRHRRHPPVYSDDTIRIFMELGLAASQHSPLIRAAGHVLPPPTVPTGHGIDFIIADIASHMARSHEPQTPQQILQALRHRQQVLDQWPKLDIALFIRRVADIPIDPTGHYHADQPWGAFLSTGQLVLNTMLRILEREQRLLATKYLSSEVERLVGRFLPDGHNTSRAIRAAARASDEVSWQGLSTFGLRAWETALHPRSITTRRSKTGDLIYAFLIRHGPAGTDEIIEHVQRLSTAKKRTVQAAINHDPANRFIRSADGRVAINPIPQNLNPDSPALKITPDGHRHHPTPVLHESEMLWITHYVQALDELAPPLPAQAALTGSRAAGFALDDRMEITVVVDDRDRPDLESRLAEAAAVASESVPSVQPQISILSVEQWTERMDGATPEAHHNVWLAPGATP